MSFALENQRKLTDINLQTVATLPNAANTNIATPSISLNGESFSTSEHYGVGVTIDPLANFGTTGALTVVIQDSADNVTFANISELGSTVINANTAAATSDQYRLPPTARAYIRALAATSNINGNIAANNVTLSLLF